MISVGEEKQGRGYGAVGGDPGCGMEQACFDETAFSTSRLLFSHTEKEGFTLKLINIGYGNLVAAERVLAVVSPESAPIKRIVQDSREIGMLIDASFGRKTKSVLIMDSGHTILSALTPEAVGQRTEEGEEENE